MMAMCYGEAWMSTEGRHQHNGKLISHWSQNLRDFATWIRGEHTPIVCTNVKRQLVRHILIWHVLMHTVWTIMKEIMNG